jgi:succinoglycan biosynthesis transport protein ExoP
LLNATVFSDLGRALLESGYDHILFDSPPTLSVSDPVIISSVIDYGVLVVRAGQTARQSVKAAAEKLQKAKAGHFGAVLNDVNTEALGSRYYHYQQYIGREESGPGRQNDDNQTGSATG